MLISARSCWLAARACFHCSRYFSLQQVRLFVVVPFINVDGQNSQKRSLRSSIRCYGPSLFSIRSTAGSTGMQIFTLVRLFELFLLESTQTGSLPPPTCDHRLLRKTLSRRFSSSPAFRDILPSLGSITNYHIKTLHDSIYMSGA